MLFAWFVYMFLSPAKRFDVLKIIHIRFWRRGASQLSSECIYIFITYLILDNISMHCLF